MTGSTVVEDLTIHDIDIILNLFRNPPTSTAPAARTSVACSWSAGDARVPLREPEVSKKIRMIYIEEEEFTIEGDFMTQEITIYR